MTFLCFGLHLKLYTVIYIYIYITYMTYATQMLYICMYVYTHIFAYLFYFCASGGEKHQTYSELESWVLVSQLSWMLGLNLGPLEKHCHTLNC